MPAKQLSGCTKVLIGFFACFMIAIFLFISYNIGNTREVYFLNGLPTQYSITVEGESYILRPGHVSEIPLGDGEFRIEIDNKRLGIDPIDLSIKTSFFTRLFSQDVFIVNPDACGIILWENIPYAETVTTKVDEMYEDKIYFGENQYHFKEIDFPFEESPDEIEIDSSGVVMRQALTDYSLVEYGDNLDPLYEDYGEEAVYEYLRMIIALNPMDPDIAYYTSYYMSAPLAVNLLESALDKRLDDVNFHRNYQEVAKMVYDDKELTKRYKNYLDASPGNPDLNYLLGRITLDPQESIALYQKAYSGENPSAWAVWAYTYYLLSVAQYQKALEFSQSWVKRFPDREELKSVPDTVAMAIGDYASITQKFEAEFRNKKKDDDFLLQDHYFVLLAYCLAGDPEGADPLLSWLGSTKNSDYKMVADNSKSYLSEMRSYIVSQGNNLKSLDIPDETTYFTIEALLLAGKYEEAEKLNGDLSLSSWHTSIQFGLSAMLKGDAQQGREYFSVAADMLEDMSYDYKIYADALRGKSMNHALLREQSIIPNDKVMLLLAMAYLTPDEQQANATLAKALNYSFQYPQYLIQAALADLLVETPETQKAEEEITPEDIGLTFVE